MYLKFIKYKISLLLNKNKKTISILKNWRKKWNNLQNMCETLRNYQSSLSCVYSTSVINIFRMFGPTIQHKFLTKILKISRRPFEAFAMCLVSSHVMTIARCISWRKAETAIRSAIIISNSTIVFLKQGPTSLKFITWDDTGTF